MTKAESSIYHPAGGDPGSDGSSASGGFLIEFVCGHKINRKGDLDSVLLGFGHQVFDDAGTFLIKQRGTNLNKKKQKKSISATDLGFYSYPFLQGRAVFMFPLVKLEGV